MRMNEVKETRVLLTDEQKRQTLEDFYRSVAQSAGYEEKEDTMYDCCRILVAANVQDAIIEAYQEAHPNVEMSNIMMLLAISGPKVDRELAYNEVRIQTGFVGRKNRNEEGEQDEKDI
jgi:hypothetical protein